MKHSIFVCTNINFSEFSRHLYLFYAGFMPPDSSLGGQSSVVVKRPHCNDDKDKVRIPPLPETKIRHWGIPLQKVYIYMYMYIYIYIYIYMYIYIYVYVYIYIYVYVYIYIYVYVYVYKYNV